MSAKITTAAAAVVGMAIGVGGMSLQPEPTPVCPEGWICREVRPDGPDIFPTPHPDFERALVSEVGGMMILDAPLVWNGKPWAPHGARMVRRYQADELAGAIVAAERAGRARGMISGGFHELLAARDAFKAAGVTLPEPVGLEAPNPSGR